MTLEIFAICDAATVSGGKLNILGAFDSIYSAEAPIVHSQCALAVRLRFSRIEEGQHQIKVQLIDEDGKIVWPGLDGKIGVRFSGDDDSAVTNFIVNMQQLKFERFGTYSMNLALDGRHESSLPLVVKPTKRKQGTSAE